MDKSKEGCNIVSTDVLVEVSVHYHKDIRKYHKLTQEQVYGDLPQREAIGMDMQLHGQKDPILLWKKGGKTHLLDGRNRLSGCVLKGISKVWARYIPSNAVLQDIREMLVSSRARVHESDTQRAIQAYRLTKGANKITQQQASKVKGVSIRQIKYCASIDKLRPSVLDSVFESNRLVLPDGKPISSLRMIEAVIKEQEAVLTRDVRDDATTGLNVLSDEDKQKMAIMFEYANACVKAMNSIGDKDLVDRVLFAVKTNNLEK